jgi:hypothetical protein
MQLYNMFIEDLIDRIACEGSYMFSTPLFVSTNDFKIISSFSLQIAKGDGLTEKQKNLSLKILKKYSSILTKDLGIDINLFLDSPQMRLPTRTISQDRTIKIEKDIEGVKQIVVKFPYDKKIIDQISNLRKNSTTTDRISINWDSEKKHWKFGLAEQNIMFLSSWKNFYKDPTFEKYAEQIKEIESQIENFVPMITLDDANKFVYKNVSKLIPPIETNDLVEALLTARKFGITCWCEKIDGKLNNSEINTVVKTFLKSGYLDKLISTGQPISLLDIDRIINFYENILFIIPSGSEFKFLKSAYDALISKGYKSEDMSVLFRLENACDPLQCNKFIHDHLLNNQVTTNIKFVFISGKIPKPLIELNKKFDLVLNYGTNSAHYTMQNFLKNHHNVVTMISTIPSKDWNYVYV